MRYPIFKMGERCRILDSIFSESPEWAQSRLRGSNMIGMVVQREQRRKGRRPVYTVELDMRLYSIYANHLEKVERGTDVQMDNSAIRGLSGSIVSF